MKSVIDNLFPEKDWTQDEIDNLIFHANDDRVNLLSIPSQKPKIEIKEKTWEHLITGERGYTVGFADMLVKIKVPFLSYPNEGIRGTRYYDPSSNIKNVEAEVHFSTEYIVFEVKPKILSLGEVIRQIRKYQAHLPGTYVVVCPDDKFAGRLAEQGIKFVKCDLV
jgi:hypothetical protein